MHPRLDFQIQGYRTLDGQNCCTDTITVLLNGAQVLVGTYALGGGGANVTTFLLPGAGLAVNSPARTLTFSAGAVSLLNGNNTLSFSYTGAAQGTGDEAWGINTATVTGNAFNPVPEPSAWALMIVGFGAVGGALRSRRKVRTALIYA